jgi:predicted Rossmann fold nucleotide-binding protein DprA/Smf involved in DNA uptake
MTPLSALEAAMAWSALPQVGDRCLLRILDYARDRETSLAALWRELPADFVRQVRLPSQAGAALQTEQEMRRERAVAAAQSARTWGVDLLLAGDAEFPAVLRPPAAASERGWAMIYAYGALPLLDQPRVGILSSRDATEPGVCLTDALADALARRDAPLVTSTNKRTYQATATAAKRQAGSAVLVLDRGLADAFPSGFQRDPVATARVWDAAFDPELQLLVSPFAWDTSWTPRSGARRDALVADLSTVLVAVDVRTGGNIDRELRGAAKRSKHVFAIDRGDPTPAGTRALWEECPEIHRIAWQGGERAAEEILGVLPSTVRGEPPAQQAWRSEIFRFLARCCHALGAPRRLRVSALHGSAELARWLPLAGPPARPGDPASCVLADLAGPSTRSLAALGEALARLPNGGLLGAVVPATWLDDPEHRPARELWLRAAAPRVVAELPASPRTDPGARTAMVVFQRGRSAGSPPASFAPSRPEMGRFDLRRYLQEILDDLTKPSSEAV